MRLALLGDVALFGRFCINENPDVLNELDRVRTFLHSHDVVIANLETPFSDHDRPYGAKSAHIRSSSRNIEILKYLGITHVTLANNHLGDFGPGSYALTKKLLDEAGIAWFGIEGRQQRIHQHGVRIALLGYCAYNTNPLFTTHDSCRGVHVLDVDRVLSEMAANAADGYLNIIAVHSGQEHVPMPSQDDVLFARGLAQRFDYVYYGHHPHVIQGVEVVGRSPIFYSLGNCLFDDVYTPREPDKPLISLSEANKTGLIASINVEGNSVTEWDAVPIYLSEKQVLVGADLPDFRMEEPMAYLTRAGKPDYAETRQHYISRYLAKRRARRDLKWYLRRLNLTSVRLILNARRNARLQAIHFQSKLDQLK